MQTHTDRSACCYISTYRSHIGTYRSITDGLPAPTLVLAFPLYVSSAATLCVSAYWYVIDRYVPIYDRYILYVCLRTDLEIGLLSGAVMALRDACEVSRCLFFLFFLHFSLSWRWGTRARPVAAFFLFCFCYGVEGRVRGQSLPLFFPSFFSFFFVKILF